MSKQAGRTALYRVYDAEGGLLYVGISANPDLRFGQHSQLKEWWTEVADRKIEWHPTRESAASAERDAIQIELPKWNSRLSARVGGAQEVFAQYKAHVEGERALREAMREAAADELRAGATVTVLARSTGLTPEVFRRLARELGVERKRPPTVGKDAPPAAP